jgi:hypothetical protein
LIAAKWQPKSEDMMGRARPVQVGDHIGAVTRDAVQAAWLNRGDTVCGGRVCSAYCQSLKGSASANRVSISGKPTIAGHEMPT